jgi:hypothetical protein
VKWFLNRPASSEINKPSSVLNSDEKSSLYASQDRLFLDLLAEIANCLGYNLKQTEIDKFYIPAAHGWSISSQAEIQTELLRVLKNSESYSESKKNN